MGEEAAAGRRRSRRTRTTCCQSGLCRYVGLMPRSRLRDRARDQYGIPTLAYNTGSRPDRAAARREPAGLA